MWMLPSTLSSALSRRRTILALAVIGTVPAFGVTDSLIHRSRERRQQLAVDWVQRGHRDLAAGRAAQAADDFRAAQQYARDPREYRLQPAEALISDGHFVEAQSQLLTLGARQP